MFPRIKLIRYLQNQTRAKFLQLNLFLCFTALEKSYNVSIRNSSGRIYPPDMDGNGLYDYNVRCVWTVEVDRHHMIDVRLSDIRMNLWYTRCVDHLLVI